MAGTARGSARAALEDLLRHGGTLPWAVFSRRWGQLRAVGPGRLEREELWREPVSPTEGLWYRGLLQRAYQEQAGSRVEVIFVPEELQLYLPEPPPLEIPPPEPATPPLHILPGTDTLADDLVTLWAFLQTEPVYLSPEGEWPMSQREALLAQCAGDRRALALLERLALEQGWIHVDGRGLLRPPTDPMLTWLRADPWTQWASLGRAWMESRRWNDLSFVSTLRPDPALGWPNDPLSARRAFLEVMRRCTSGVWYSLSGFVEYAKEYATDFLRPDGDYEAWGLRDALTDASLRGFDAWESVEGALAAFVLTGPMVWLGLLDLGSVAPGLPPTIFRLSPAGAALLQHAEPPAFSEPPPLRLYNSGALAVPALRRYERFQVNRVARLLSRSGGDSHDAPVYRYRITPGSLHRAKQQRIPPDRIADFLEETTGKPLSEGLRETLARAYREGAAVRMVAGWILQVRDPETLELPALRRFVQETLGPRAALIREVDRDRVMAVLTREGLLPEIDV